VSAAPADRRHAGPFRGWRFLAFDLGRLLEIQLDQPVIIQPQVAGIGANEHLREHTAWQLLERVVFDGVQKIRADLGDLGDIVKGQVLFLALLFENLSNRGHR